MTQLAKKQKTLKDWLQSSNYGNEIQAALPQYIGKERFIRAAVTAQNINPKLRNCTPESFLNSCLQLAQYGLVPDGRNAHLIPYKQTCTLVIDYKGLVDLLWRTGKFAKIHADVVYTKDVFEYNLGEVIKHVPQWSGDRGEAFLFYAIAITKEGQQISQVMTVQDVNKVRDGVFGSNKPDSPWTKWYEEMGKKTVFKRLTKFLPLSEEAQGAVDLDNQIETTSFADERPAKVEEPPPSTQETPPPSDEVIDADVEVVEPESNPELEAQEPPAKGKPAKGKPAKKAEPAPEVEEDDIFNTGE